MSKVLDLQADESQTEAMRKWLPLVTVSLGTFMLLIDVTIVNVALPKMATDLHSSFTSLQWVIDIYALTLAALLLAVGAFTFTSQRMGGTQIALCSMSASVPLV